ncbi:MAG: sigma-70 family RNA polymerase sigma factor, partial [Rhizobiales bacterium]|nr:sigma-70 family RNA polymerase sigma factor [Hyphomicrobiales bacterium]
SSLVFTRAFAKLATCDDCCFRAWLFAIANNVIVDRTRSPRPLERPLDDALYVADPQRGPEAAALASEAARELAALLDRLPADQRRVVELRLAGLTGPEIASVLGRSHDAVKKLQGRAIAKLRDLAAKEERFPEGATR